MRKPAGLLLALALFAAGCGDDDPASPQVGLDGRWAGTGLLPITETHIYEFQVTVEIGATLRGWIDGTEYETTLIERHGDDSIQWRIDDIRFAARIDSGRISGTPGMLTGRCEFTETIGRGPFELARQ